MRKEVKPQPEEPKIIEDKSKEISPAKNNTLSNKNVFNIGAIATVSAIATTADEGVKKEMIQLKEELRIEKEKHNNDNQLYESKLKQKDKDHTEVVEQLKQKYKNDLEQYEKTYKDKETSLNEEISRLKREIHEQVESERNKNELIHKAAIETLERNWNNKLESQKREFEKQKE